MAEEVRNLYNLNNSFQLGVDIKKIYSNFDLEKYFEKINKYLLDLTLFEREKLILDSLEENLPKDVEQIVDILLKSKQKELNPDSSFDVGQGEDFSFIDIPGTRLISKLCSNEKYFDLGLNAIFEMTKSGSSEWPIRDFIIFDKRRSINFILEKTKSKNVHERRLCSEGIRPRIPWGIGLKEFKEDPSLVIYVLDNLYFDNSRYVTRSVCNCLNDIAKDHPKIVVETLGRWEEDSKQNEVEFEWMKKHALRTLIKKGDMNTLNYLGFKEDLNLDFNFKLIEKKVQIGNALEFELDVVAKEDCSLLIDYLIHFKLKNGKYNNKVFKLKVLNLKEGEKINLSKKHPLRIMTTKKLYFGIQKIEIQINGKIVASDEFELVL